MARINLGLSSEEFWESTPRQLQHLMRRYRDEARHRELLAGIISSTIANCSFGSSGERKPADFMPSEKLRRRDQVEDRAAVAQATGSLFDDLMTQQKRKFGT